MSSTLSIIKVINSIVSKQILETTPTTTNKTLVFSQGSNLTKVKLSKLSF